MIGVKLAFETLQLLQGKEVNSPVSGIRDVNSLLFSISQRTQLEEKGAKERRKRMEAYQESAAYQILFIHISLNPHPPL